jgi:hypothetical protein
MNLTIFGSGYPKRLAASVGPPLPYRTNTRAAVYIGVAYYFLDHYDESVEPFDRALTRSRMQRSAPSTCGPRGDLCRDRQRLGCRRLAGHHWTSVAVFDAHRFAAQFGIDPARNHMLEGEKAGFH